MLLDSDQSQISLQSVQQQIQVSMQKSRWLKSRLIYNSLTHVPANKFTHWTFNLLDHYVVYGLQNVILHTRCSMYQNMPVELLLRRGILSTTRATFWTEILTLHYSLWDCASWMCQIVNVLGQMLEII